MQDSQRGRTCYAWRGVAKHMSYELILDVAGFSGHFCHFVGTFWDLFDSLAILRRDNGTLNCHCATAERPWRGKSLLHTTASSDASGATPQTWNSRSCASGIASWTKGQPAAALNSCAAGFCVLAKCAAQRMWFQGLIQAFGGQVPIRLLTAAAAEKAIA